MVSNTAHTTMMKVIPRNKLNFFDLLQEILWNALLKAYSTMMVQIRASSGHRNPGVEKVLFIMIVFIFELLFFKTDGFCITGIPAKCNNVIVIRVCFNGPGKAVFTRFYCQVTVQ